MFFGFFFLHSILHVSVALACLTVIQDACILVESGKKLPAGAVPIIGLQPEVKGVLLYLVYTKRL